MPNQKTSSISPLSLYVHWPYCLHKCPYCDFASTASPILDDKLLLRTYERDMDCFRDNRMLRSLFFGGGTPSLMSLSLFEQLMQAIQKRYVFAPDIEISLEVNPDAVDKKKLTAFRKLGVNRLSIGVQALNERDLNFLGRTHTLKRAIECVEEAQTVFDNINMDLIYARPHQTLKDWEQELQKALQFSLSHYSLYQLTIEENTVFAKRGQAAASQTQARRLYQLTDAIMNKARRPAYEVSNYAQRGFECRHNMGYWLGYDYIGIGPSAHGRLGLFATSNARTVGAWISNKPMVEKLTVGQRDLEKLLMGLRLRQHPFPAQKLNSKSIQKALQKKWIVETKKGILPTQAGILMLNQLILLLSE